VRKPAGTPRAGPRGRPPGAGGAGGGAGCDRAGLQAAVDSYLAAMEAGDPALMSLAAAATYEENAETVALGQGLWATPLHADQALSCSTCRAAPPSPR
jgi:cytochrome c peroxidase